jgi:putative redox protein
MAEGVGARAVFRGGWATDVTMRDHAVRVDEPPAEGGGDTGPMPTELLAGSLASCFCLAMAWVARKRELELPGLEVSVRAERAGREPRYGRFVVETRCALPLSDWEHLLPRAARVCWVSNTMTGAVEVEYRALQWTDVS